jgi:serine/threonine protein kinase
MGMAAMDQRKFGRYEIKTELGRGGMGIVYDAFDPRFEREVALKVLPREMLRDVQSRIRFEREAKTIAMLEDPAIVPVYDFGEEDGQPYFVMRYMTGGSLSDRMRKGPMTVQESARILTRLAPTLDEAHAKGIIHRDLKPGNILFDQFNEPYISDFGIAKLFASQTNVTGSAIIGTPAYMSPEQAQGENIDGRSDLYALAVILYEMLTGQQPYHGDTPMNVVVKQITEPVPHILDVKPDLPADIGVIIEKVMAKDRNNRYQDVKSLANALNMVAHGERLGKPAPESTVVSSDRTVVTPPNMVVTSSKPVAASPETVIASKLTSQTPPGVDTGKVPPVPDSVSTQRSSWMRYLWIAVPLVLLACIAVVAVIVSAMKKSGLAGLSSLGNHTPTPSEISALPPASTSTPNFTVKTGLTGITLFTGPGEFYPEATFIYDDVKVIGQIDGCAWYKVVSVTDPSIYGWVSADKLNYQGNCSDVKLVDIPPTPLPSATFTLIPSATFTLAPTNKPDIPGQPTNNCKAQSAMTLGNRTGAYADFQLVGPGTFYVSLPPDVNTTFPVCEGCYDVYILNGNNGCGYSEGEFMGHICDGFNGWLQCD